MEKCERPAPPLQHRRSRSKNPSFSSTLLDAIYRSIDQEQHPDSDDARRGSPADRSSARHIYEEEQQLRTPRSSSANSCCRTPRPTPPACHRDVLPGPRHRRSVIGAASSSSSSSSASSSAATTAATTSTTTSATCSSSTGFSSSSDAESVHRIHRLDPQAQEKKKKKKKSKCGSIRGGLRGLRKGREPTSATAPRGTTPASPGARLASFLNALFSSAGSPRKTKVVTPTAATSSGTSAAVSVGGDDSASRSSASSCRRSCLSKAAPATARRMSTGAEAGKRSVRFYPVSVVVDEESRPCGHKRLQDEAVAARVEELLRVAAAGEEEDDNDEEGSESSSDLFELENLVAVMEGGREGGNGDELPLYETTDLNTNRAIAHGLIH